MSAAAVPPMTLTEKILLQHAVGWTRPTLRPGDALWVAIDWALASEVSWRGMRRTYEGLGRPALFDRQRVYLAIDHTVDAYSREHDPVVRVLVSEAREFARERGLRYFYDANTTIMHTEFARELARPGDLIVGADSHTSSHGAVGAFAIGLGGADVVAAMVLGRTWIQVPESIRIHYSGRLPAGLTGKDVILKTLGELGRNTIAMERAVEYTADHPEDFSADVRFTIANMTAELGGLNGIFCPDAETLAALERRRDHEFRTGGTWFHADEDAAYAERRSIALHGLPPQVAKPYSPDNVCDIEAAAGEPLDGCFIGACTTTEEELVLAAQVLQRALATGRRPVPSSNRLLVPGSLDIVRHLGERNLLRPFEQAGFRVGEPGCSMCIGMGADRARPGEVWLSSQNRNFPNRMGKGSTTFLASALTVAASSLDLRIADPRPLVSHAAGPPATTAISGTAPYHVRYVEPSPTNRVPDPPVTFGESAGVGRIHGAVQRFGDNIDTDAIIPAEFCHSVDPAFLGRHAFAHVRPDFAARVAAGQTVIVAGRGWGTGSSREHAVWALKGAGVQAIIARSVAYIHKRNLINEALPLLVLEDDRFYSVVNDGELITVDLARGLVIIGGQEFLAASPGEHGPIQIIRSAGGLMPCVAAQLTGFRR